MHKTVLSIALLALTASVAHPQGNSKHTRKHKGDPDKVTATGGVMVPGWTGRIDPQSEKQGRKLTDAKFVVMGTGFHVTSGPAAVYWNPANTASGNYTVSAAFTQTKVAAHPEGYGLVTTGADLKAANQSYGYFLVRQDGKFLINHRADDSTVHKIVPWTDNAAINKLAEGGKATNKLSIEFNPADVVYRVNGTEVFRIPRANLGGVKGTQGILGLRVNHNLDVHVDGFSVTQAK